MNRTPSGARQNLLFFVAAMFLVGLQMAETGAALGAMSRSLALSASQQGLLVSLRFIGGLGVGLLLWRAHRLVPLKVALSIALLSSGLSGLFLLSPSYGGMTMVALFRGIANGAIIPLSGIYAATQRTFHPGTVASTVNAAVSLGLVTMAGGALLLTSALELGWVSYFVPAVPLSLLLLVALYPLEFPRKGAGGSPERTHWPSALVGFLIVGGEAVLLGMVPAISATLGAARNLALSGEGYALILMVGVLAGRTAGTLLLGKLGSPRVLLFSITSLTLFGLLWSLLPRAAFLSVFLLGVSTANLYPGLISYVAERRPQRARATVAAAGWTGGTGGIVVPLVAGLLMEAGLPGSALSAFVALPAAGGVAWLLASTSREKAAPTQG